ncbi:hypothetical protein N431DRAFT_148724 [Stipitochalara longipes BDJ]|nr:hypothetical protein N431DRAFT_148724 [Stipitochalara longipes BDJ]
MRLSGELTRETGPETHNEGGSESGRPRPGTTFLVVLSCLILSGHCNPDVSPRCAVTVYCCPRIFLVWAVSWTNSSDESSTFPIRHSCHGSPVRASRTGEAQQCFGRTKRGILHGSPCLKGSRLQHCTEVWRRILEGVHLSGGASTSETIEQQDACKCQISCQQASRRLMAPQIRHPYPA